VYHSTLGLIVIKKQKSDTQAKSHAAGAFQARKAAKAAQSGGEKDVPIRDRRALIQQVENRKRMAVNIPPKSMSLEYEPALEPRTASASR